MLGSKCIWKSAFIVIQHSALRLSISCRFGTTIACLCLLVSIRVLATVNHTCGLGRLTFCLGWESPQVLTLIAKLYVLWRSSFWILFSHCSVHHLGWHTSWALVVDMLTRKTVVQDRILNGSHTTCLVDQWLLTLRLVVIALADDLMTIDVATLFWNWSASQNVHAHDIVLEESFSPSLRDTVLYFVLDHCLVGALGKSLSQRLLMQLIELVIELCDHLLDVGTLLFSIESLEHCNFDILLWKDTLLQQVEEWLLHKNVLNLSILVGSQKLDVSLVNLTHKLWVHLNGLVWLHSVLIDSISACHATGRSLYVVRESDSLSSCHTIVFTKTRVIRLWLYLLILWKRHSLRSFIDPWWRLRLVLMHLLNHLLGHL